MDLPAGSVVRMPTQTNRPRLSYPKVLTLRRPGTTCRAAVADKVPVSIGKEAVTVASPSVRKAVKVPVLPSVGEIEPMRAGVSDHVAETGKRLPKESRPDAVSCLLPRAVTSAEAGVTTNSTGGPGVTVSVCVPLVVSGADAMSVGLPARVSR
jgi:hypothetical protein